MAPAFVPNSTVLVHLVSWLYHFDEERRCLRSYNMTVNDSKICSTELLKAPSYTKHLKCTDCSARGLLSGLTDLSNHHCRSHVRIAHYSTQSNASPLEFQVSQCSPKCCRHNNEPVAAWVIARAMLPAVRFVSWRCALDAGLSLGLAAVHEPQPHSRLRYCMYSLVLTQSL